MGRLYQETLAEEVSAFEFVKDLGGPGLKEVSDRRV